MSRKLVMISVILTCLLLCAVVLFFGVDNKPTIAPSTPTLIVLNKNDVTSPAHTNFKLKPVSKNEDRSYEVYEWHKANVGDKLSFSYSFNASKVINDELKNDISDPLKANCEINNKNHKATITVTAEFLAKHGTVDVELVLIANTSIKIVIRIYGK